MIIRQSLFIITGLFSVMLLGCAAQEKATRHASSDSSDADSDYTIIYLLHGDADYLYHSEEGQPLQADEEVLKEAQSVAKNAENGEVFIFHQRPEQEVLWLFPKKDRHMYHYRNGEMVTRRDYSPAEREGAGAFASESMLYENHRSDAGSDNSLKRVLLYYGHEIPMQAQTGYHRSRPEVDFSSKGFAEGIAQFTGSESSPLDLLILSTCNNGTPDLLHHLKGAADYVLASPQNLHLSHIDSDSLSVLESQDSLATADLAAKVADQTLGRMSKFIQTGVTLSLYDTDIVGKYVADLDRRIAGLTSRKEQATPAAVPTTGSSAVNAEYTATGAAAENIDCADLLPDQLLSSSGISVWFQPPAFGPQSGRKSHSGWGCVDPKN